MKVSSENIFDPGSAPSVVKELTLLEEGVVALPRYFKADMIISFLRDRCLKNHWIQANPEMMKALLSRRFITVNAEAQFNFCRTKPAYRLDYEAYIREFFRGRPARLYGYTY